MLKLNSKFLFSIFFVITFLFTNLSASASIKGGILKSHFFDTQNTVMTQLNLDKSVKTGKYWDKNLFYVNRYRPLFMLSNKELYDLMPQEEQSVVQRIVAPSVYNISLKTASVTKISLAPDRKSLKTVTVSKPLSQNAIVEPLTNISTETAEEKLNEAIFLKNTNKNSNYSIALNILNQVTKVEPYNAQAYCEKGDIYYLQGDMENSMRNYAQALKINPYCKEGCLGIAKILEPTDKVLAQKYLSRANSL